MRRNRKYQTAALRFGPALKAFLLCLLIGGSGVGYVWQESQIDQLGRQIKEREVKLRDAEMQNKKLGRQLATMRSVRFLEIRNRELNLGLVLPPPNQVVTLAEPTEDAMPAKPASRTQQFASQQ